MLQASKFLKILYSKLKISKLVSYLKTLHLLRYFQAPNRSLSSLLNLEAHPQPQNFLGHAR